MRPSLPPRLFPALEKLSLAPKEKTAHRERVRRGQTLSMQHLLAVILASFLFLHLARAIGPRDGLIRSTLSASAFAPVSIPTKGSPGEKTPFVAEEVRKLNPVEKSPHIVAALNSEEPLDILSNISLPQEHKSKVLKGEGPAAGHKTTFLGLSSSLEMPFSDLPPDHLQLSHLSVSRDVYQQTTGPESTPTPTPVRTSTPTRSPSATPTLPCDEDIHISISTTKDVFARVDPIELTSASTVSAEDVAKVLPISSDFLGVTSLSRGTDLSNAQSPSPLGVGSCASSQARGYILEFQEPCVVEKSVRLKQQMKAGDLADDLSLQDYLIAHRIVLEDEHNRMKSAMLKQLKRKSLHDLLLGEYFLVFNGVALDITEDEARELTNHAGIKSVQANTEMHLTLDESVPLIQADQVWDRYPDGSPCPEGSADCLRGDGVTIGIIDTGIDTQHPDLDDGKVIEEHCYCKDNCCPNGKGEQHGVGSAIDEDGHGTHVAAIAAGNGVLKGVAPDASLIVYKVFGTDELSYVSDYVKALEHAVDPDENLDFSDHLDVVSVSMGGAGAPWDLQSRATDNAVDAGIVAVVAAGNSGPDGENFCGDDHFSICSPATAAKAISVGASTKLDFLASYSSIGPAVGSIGGNSYFLMKPDLLAPGSSICSAKYSDSISLSTCVDSDHYKKTGTSMAAPHVAGAAALLLQKHPDWTPQQIKDALMFTADDLGYSKSEQGAGRVNVLEAIRLDEPPEYCFYCRNKSEIVNNGSDISSGTLKFKMYRFYSDFWKSVKSSEEYVVEILPGESLDLNDYFNESTGYQLGEYKIKAVYRSDTECSAEWEFAVFYDYPIATDTPTVILTHTSTPTEVPTHTPTETVAPTNTYTPTPIDTVTRTPTPTWSRTSSATVSPTMDLNVIKDNQIDARDLLVFYDWIESGHSEHSVLFHLSLHWKDLVPSEEE